MGRSFLCKFVSQNILTYKVVNSIFSEQESISPTNLRNAQSPQHNENGSKDAVLFHQHFCWNLTACFRLELWSTAPYLGTFLPNAVSIKCIKIYLQKNCSVLALKMLIKLTPGNKFFLLQKFLELKQNFHINKFLILLCPEVPIGWPDKSFRTMSTMLERSWNQSCMLCKITHDIPRDARGRENWLKGKAQYNWVPH